MAFTFFDHTGDIGVHLTGRTLDDLFCSAAHAFTESVSELRRVEPRRAIALSLESTGLDLLLVDFLNEMLYHFETEQFLVAAVNVSVRAHSRDLGRERSYALPAAALQAVLHGEPFDGQRHGMKVLIKAVTYHALEVREEADGWHATVVFDV